MSINNREAPATVNATIPTSEIQAEIIARALTKSYGLNGDLELTRDLPYNIDAVAVALERLGYTVRWNLTHTAAQVRRKAAVRLLGRFVA